MNKKSGKAILSIFIAISCVLYVLPLEAAPALNWNNPNAGTSPYRPKGSDFVNPRLLMSVVGCTGIVNRAAERLTAFTSKHVIEKLKDKVQANVCGTVKKGTAAGSAATSTCALGNCSPVGKELAEIIFGVQCPTGTTHVDDKTTVAAVKQKQTVDQCLTGIAIHLAKNQLTAMTRDTFNWVNTGFNGDPFFVRNINEAVNNIEKSVLIKETDLFRNSDAHTAQQINYMQPYGADFARAAITSYKVKSNLSNALNQDLTSYLTPGSTPASFATDFSRGGWDGWLALTQHSQNNPLGYTMLKAQDIADKQAREVQNEKDALARNGGYRDEKKCVEYEKTPPTPPPITSASIRKGFEAEFTDAAFPTTPTTSAGGISAAGFAAANAGAIAAAKPPKCLRFETITPGSAIRDKIDQAINLPERQTELVKTMNDALNTLFSALLGKLFNGGISGLSSVKGQYTDIADINLDNAGTIVSSTGTGGNNNQYDSSSALGNKYTEAIDAGEWDANMNTPTLSPNRGVRNQFYTVSANGNTKLFAGVGHRWARGEKAFFNGTVWGVGVPNYVIDTRGGLQMQYDFNTISTQALEVLPQVIPKIGELDYCIPGPNLNWANNSTDVKDAFSSYIDQIGVRDKPVKVCDKWNLCATQHTEHRNGMYLGDPTFYKAFFDNLPEFWNRISESQLFTTPVTIGTEIDPSVVDDERQYITNATNSLWNEYTQKVNALYGPQGLMQNPILQDAGGNTLGDNQAYLPMATTGLSMTKNIVEQADTIDTDIKNYQEEVVQNNANIYKLNSIKKRMNEIIADAQRRRATKRNADGLPIIKKICLDNEKVTYVVNDVIKY